ncbi:hypothetical protein EST38_g14184 [Candolleomyces aberdarensis]|uniref:JmjC domain-containing protein n=1 Tax=Candolleomyces aberdarensis TaxID=2316362 RepID=A0A4Q2D0C6_9AGAR|nr:hypothetical protein EST38_g14184 [Candolleomyces aberdarensis]
MKVWFVGRSRDTGDQLDAFVEKKDDFACWGVDDDYEVEGILLTPGTQIIMPPGMLHAVFTIEASVCSGCHYYSWPTMELTLHALVRSVILCEHINNTEEYGVQCRQILIRMMCFLHEVMILGDETHETNADLPRLTTAEDWRVLSSFFCLIKLLNVVTRSTYCPIKLPNRLAQETNHISLDQNQLSIDERQDMVWARGLIGQSMPVLSGRYGFDFEADLFDPMLAYYAVYIKTSFESAHPSPNTLFAEPYVYEMFQQQLQWVLDSRPAANDHYRLLSKMERPPQSMKYTDWTPPENFKWKEGQVCRRKSVDFYYMSGVHHGDILFFSAA